MYRKRKRETVSESTTFPAYTIKGPFFPRGLICRMQLSYQNCVLGRKEALAPLYNASSLIPKYSPYFPLGAYSRNLSLVWEFGRHSGHGNEFLRHCSHTNRQPRRPSLFVAYLSCYHDSSLARLQGCIVVPLEIALTLV